MLIERIASPSLSAVCWIALTVASMSFGQAQAQQLTIGTYHLQTSVRVSATQYDYSYTADLSNSGSAALDVVGTVTSSSPNTLMTQGSVDFGPSLANSTTTSSTTFTIRQDRRFPFSPQSLSWSFAVNPGLTTTTTRLDGALPSTVFTSIAQVVSTADSESPGTPLWIPSVADLTPTLILAVDQNQNPILAAFANSDTTVLSVDSTAVALVLSALDPPSTPVLSYAQLAADVQGAASYSQLASDVQASLQAGTAPVTSPTVLADVATVVNQIIPVVLSQVSAAASTQSSLRVKAAVLAPTEIATPPLPFQILGPIASLATFYSVFINAADGNGGVDLTNKLPIALHAYSADLGGNPIDPGKLLPSAPPLFAYPQTATDLAPAKRIP